MDMKQDTMYCAKCDKPMKLGVLPRYEYEEGYPLHHVQAYVCPRYRNIFFSEKQAHALAAQTQELKGHTFGFERKVTISGRSLVVGIPAELAEHLRIRQGQNVKIVPIAREGLMIKKIKKAA